MPAEHRHQTVRRKWYDHMRILKGDAIFQPSLYYLLTLRDLCSSTFHWYQVWIESSIEMFFSQTRLIKNETIGCHPMEKSSRCLSCSQCTHLFQRKPKRNWLKSPHTHEKISCDQSGYIVFHKNLSSSWISFVIPSGIWSSRALS